MAFVESDRVNIRLYLGYSALFLQADPRLESAITATQAVVDGGTRPDNSSELLAKSIVTQLAAFDASIVGLSTQRGAGSVGGISIDPVRETARLRMLGRQYCHRLGRIFDTSPRADVFTSAMPDGAGYPANAFNNRSGY